MYGALYILDTKQFTHINSFDNNIWKQVFTGKCFLTSPSVPVWLHHQLIMAPEIQPLRSFLKSLNWTSEQFRSQSVFMFKLLSLDCKSTLLYFVMRELTRQLSFLPLRCFLPSSGNRKPSREMRRKKRKGIMDFLSPF